MKWVFRYLAMVGLSTVVNLVTQTPILWGVNLAVPAILLLFWTER